MHHTDAFQILATSWLDVVGRTCKLLPCDTTKICASNSSWWPVQSTPEGSHTSFNPREASLEHALPLELSITTVLILLGDDTTGNWSENIKTGQFSLVWERALQWIECGRIMLW